MACYDNYVININIQLHTVYTFTVQTTIMNHYCICASKFPYTYFDIQDWSSSWWLETFCLSPKMSLLLCYWLDSLAYSVSAGNPPLRWFSELTCPGHTKVFYYVNRVGPIQECKPLNLNKGPLGCSPILPHLSTAFIILSGPGTI